MRGQRRRPNGWVRVEQWLRQTPLSLNIQIPKLLRGAGNDRVAVTGRRVAVGRKGGGVACEERRKAKKNLLLVGGGGARLDGRGASASRGWEGDIEQRVRHARAALQPRAPRRVGAEGLGHQTKNSACPIVKAVLTGGKSSGIVVIISTSRRCGGVRGQEGGLVEAVLRNRRGGGRIVYGLVHWGNVRSVGA